MLTQENTVLVLIDVQGKLAQLMDDKDILFANLQRMVQAAQALDIPILWVEQNPDKLGTTIPELTALLDDQQPFAKMTFSCARNADFMTALELTGRKHVLAMGIETHICVCQTVTDLLTANYAVDVISDATGTRIASNKTVGLARMSEQGARLSSTEMALFEIMQTAEHSAFRSIQQIVK